MLQLSRRKFLSGLFAAPAIIAIDRLMPVKALWTPPPILWPLEPFDTGPIWTPDKWVVPPPSIADWQRSVMTAVARYHDDMDYLTPS